MNPSEFDLTGASRVHWDLEVGDDRVLDPWRDALKEDLIQIVFDGAVVDVGWYPAFSPEGCFRTVVVADEDWEKPVLVTESRSLSDLRASLVAAIAEARRIHGGS